MRNSPGILSVNSESLNVLREAPVAGGSKSTTDAGSRIGRRIALLRRRNEVKLRFVGGLDIGVIGIDDELFLRRRERPGQHRFMNEVSAALDRMIARIGAHVVTQLEVFLIEQLL